MVAICLLAQPLAVGAVVIIGTVVVAVAIKEELDAHARRRQAQTQRSQQKPVANGEPKPGGLGRDWFPPRPPESQDPRERRPECTPRRVPPKGGNPLHNVCADNVPLNAFRGANALVNGKAYDALQLAMRMLWEVKTDNFDTYTAALQRIVVRNQVAELRRERDLARACGFDFRVGVRSAAHKAELERVAPDLEGIIVVMDWC
jgi:hypothetical protein